VVKENIIQTKTFNFALKIIVLYRSLKEKNEFVLSKQLLRSGTSIGANVEEALAGQSRKDFIAKMSIASKEAKETRYWLRLLESSQIHKADYSSYLKDIEEIVNILTAIVKTSQTKSK
jgi:four helix bundle protein